MGEKHNYAIDLWRFILIVWVVLFHYTANPDFVGILPNFPYKFSNGAFIGVSMFFVLSGFFMGRTIVNGQFTNLTEWFKYCVKRYLRFYPSYILAVIVIFLWLRFIKMPGFTVSVKTLAINLLLIIHPRVEYVDGAHWFLAELLLMQFATVLLLYIPKRYREFVVLLAFIVCYSMYSYADYLQKPPSFLTFFMTCEVKLLLGLLVYLAVTTKSMKSIVYSLFMGLAICLSINGDNLGFNYLEFMVLILIVLSLVINIRFPLKIQPIIQYLGDFSLMWYLVHQVIGYSILYNFIPNGECNEFYVLIPIIVTIIIAIILNKISGYISINKWLNRKYDETTIK